MLNKGLKSATLIAGLMLSGAAVACPDGRTLTIVVPYPPGTTDAIARLIAASIGFPQSIVENKSGADGSIGAGDVARSAPDGCSVTLASSGTVVGYPAMHQKSVYRPADFTALGEVGQYTMMLFVNPRKLPGVRSVADLASYARAHPGTLNWARPTPTSRIALAQFLWLALNAKEKDGVIVGVPYRGEKDAILDLISGRIDVVVATSAAGYEHVVSGDLVALATTGDKRNRLYPEVPSMREAGISDWSPAELSAGFYGPKGMRPEDVTIFSARLRTILETPTIRDRLERMGFEVEYRPPEEHTERVRRQADTWRRVIEYSGIKQED